jgi:hypothetical protein
MHKKIAEGWIFLLSQHRYFQTNQQPITIVSDQVAMENYLIKSGNPSTKKASIGRPWLSFIKVLLDFITMAAFSLCKAKLKVHLP